MDWTDLKKEIEDYGKLGPEDLKNIITEGMKTEFWKWLSSRIALRMQIAQMELTGADASKLDYLIAHGQFNAIYKANNLILNLPELTLKSIITQKELAQKKTESKALTTVLNAR